MLGHGQWRPNGRTQAGVVRQSKDGAWSSSLTHRRDKGGDVATGFWAIRGSRPPRDPDTVQAIQRCHVLQERRGWPVSEAAPSSHQVCTPRGSPARKAPPPTPWPSQAQDSSHWPAPLGKGGGGGKTTRRRAEPGPAMEQVLENAAPRSGSSPTPRLSFLYFFLPSLGLSQVASGILVPDRKWNLGPLQ